MSRTRKDRPHWVVENDKKHPRRVEYHDHDSAGEAIYRRKKVVDENGNPVMRTVVRSEVIGYRLWDYRAGVYKRYATFGDLLADNRAQADEIGQNVRRRTFGLSYYAEYGEVEHEYPTYEGVLVGYRPTECTINLPAPPRTTDWWGNDADYLCYHELKRWKNQGCSCCGTDRPNKKERDGYHREKRSAENNALHNLKRAANAGYEYEDDLYEDVFNQRERFHHGYWD